MKTRKLGKFEVSAVGMGCMGFSTAYGQTPPKEESIRLMRLAHEMGCTFYDTAEIYAAFRNEMLVNEMLVGEALEPIRDEIVLCTKYSPSPLPRQENMDGGKFSENGLRAALEGSLKRLRTDRIDLYYIHRIPEGAEMEEIASWFGSLIKEGKILGWGLSEAYAERIRGAHGGARQAQGLRRPHRRRDSAPRRAAQRAVRRLRRAVQITPC